MATNNSFKAPPRKTEDLSYTNWKKEVKIWSFQTKVETDKKGSVLFLSLEGKPRETVLAEVDIDKINSAEGMNEIFKCLDKFFKKDETKSAYSAFDEFIKLRRKPSVSLKDFLIDFNLKYHRIENFDMKLPDGVLAYLLLTSVNISNEKMELCRATCPHLRYDDMRETIEKVGVGSTENQTKQLTFTPMGQGTSNSGGDSTSQVTIKQEPVFVAENNSAQRINNDYDSDDSQFDNIVYDEDVYYGNSQVQRTMNYGNHRHRNDISPQSYSKKVYVKRNQIQLPRKNPRDSYGIVMRCDFCSSEYHLVANCQDCPKHLKDKYLTKRSNRSQSSQSHYL